ncbi:MAG: Hpt domain-containing protein, partial [bacterium]
PAHSLKSSSANVGAMSLSGIAKEIELGSREANLQDPAEMVETAEKIFLNVSRELRALIQ